MVQCNRDCIAGGKEPFFSRGYFASTPKGWKKGTINPKGCPKLTPVKQGPLGASGPRVTGVSMSEGEMDS